MGESDLFPRMLLVSMIGSHEWSPVNRTSDTDMLAQKAFQSIGAVDRYRNVPPVVATLEASGSVAASPM
jgi:hypothetical protein